MKKRLISLLLACSLVFTTGCMYNLNAYYAGNSAANNSVPDNDPAPEEADSPDSTPAPVTADEENEEYGEDEGKYILPEVGDTRHGFTVTERGSIDYLKAETATFIHEKSGATLFLVENEDPELAFQIAYRVPQKDGTDVPHIFEHTILAGSDKYPYTNAFFDLANTTYNTYVNAHTMPVMTFYPLASASEEQLIKMMDVYMSCMETPVVLKDRRIFEREALRYQLYDMDDPIEMTGTVFAEDLGFMAEASLYSDVVAGGAMYPDSLASNPIGMLFDNYGDLTYDHLQETYDSYYSYDNAIILLYGKLDYDRELAFFDENYLGDEERQDKNALDEYDLKPQDGFKKVDFEVPAYEGDSVAGQSVISCYFDLSDFSPEEKAALRYFGDFISSGSSPFIRKLREAGINNIAAGDSCVDSGFARDFFVFSLSNADPGQADPFYESVQAALEDIAENGFSDSLTESVLHGIVLDEALSLEGTTIGINGFINCLAHFMTTGKTDYFELNQKAKEAVMADKDQKLMKELAAKLLQVKSSCLVTAVPTPGLAEEKDAERDAFLAEMKESMSDEELEQLIEETLAFDEWNENPVHADDLMIDPEKLPEPERLPELKVTKEEGINLVSAPVNISDVGVFELLFDTSALTQEELFELDYYLLALGEMGTKEHPAEELKELLGYYTANFIPGFRYPSQEGKEHHCPYINISWISMTEDFENSLDLVLEILKDTDFSDADNNLELIGRYRESYNPASADPFMTAQLISMSALSDEYAYSAYLHGPGFYAWLNDTEDKLSEDKGYAAELSERMQNIIEKCIGKTGLSFCAVAGEEDISEINGLAVEALKELPENEAAKDVHYDLLLFDKNSSKIGIYMDTPSQYTVKRYDLRDLKDMQGRYHPFFYALSDLSVIPVMRFQRGVYSTEMVSSTIDNRAVASTFKDPNVGKTVEYLDSLPEVMKSLKLTETELDGYIANCYGEQTAPHGVLTEGLTAILYYFDDKDMEAIYERTADVRNAVLNDIEKAAELFGESAESSSIMVMTGNRGQMEKDAGIFDQILDFRQGPAND
ncbi:MAG: insulinase family protein [Lachnospiraceae bacterium]|nr:insulinase family protein [Lachnospiraceae bacterium]